MKIGILTFHCAHNYGAVLQCYALQEYLKELGHEVCVIDYRPQYLVYPYRKHRLADWISKKPLVAIKRLLTEPFLFSKRTKRWKAFDEFINNQLNILSYDSIIKSPDVDLIIFGSDQIWNLNITEGEFDEVFWGQKFPVKKITYAASCGDYDFNQHEKKKIKELLRNFSAISVRETALQALIQSLITKKVDLVCDPVFLLSQDVWKKLCQPINVTKPYLLCYNLCRSYDCDKMADYICSKEGYSRIDLTAYVNSNYVAKSYRQTASPCDFLSLFKNASFVVTSSFHGTAFSILFQKDFYAIGFGAKRGRVVSLLSLLELHDRFLEKFTENANHAIDWLKVDGLINKYSSFSKSYLENQIYK